VVVKAVESRPGVSLCPRHPDVERYYNPFGGKKKWNCYKCSADARARYIVKPGKREIQKESKISWQNRMIAEGLCRTCGKELAIFPSGYCSYHAKLRSMSHWMNRCRAVGFLGGACVVCGETDVSVLQLDHIHNDGYKERQGRHTGGDHGRLGSAAVDWVLSHQEEAKDKYQILCANCHVRKTAAEKRAKMWVD
jgi:5-methylcytosine-specific restriction endonuclease McrA